MNDRKAEAAYQDYLEKLQIVFGGSILEHKAFLAGYATASADTEAKVRAAVEATIEEARRVVWIQCDPTAIREIDVSAIVARVIQEGKSEKNL